MRRQCVCKIEVIVCWWGVLINQSCNILVIGEYCVYNASVYVIAALSDICEQTNGV